MKKAKKLLASILSMSGDKIITLVSVYMGSRSYDVKADGSIGYDASHRELFHEHLDECVIHGGGILIRVFTDQKFLGVTPKGEMLLPVKHIYGIACGGGRWAGLSEADVEESCTTDHQTGTKLPPEQGVKYCGWPPATAS